MCLQNKVFWTDEMVLNPHHFQQQERHVELLINPKTRAIHPSAMGFTRLQLDPALLNLGKIGLLDAAGVLPDGTPFDCPAIDGAPPLLEVPAAVKATTVLLAVPERRLGGQDAMMDRQGAERAVTERLCRHRIENFEVRDNSADGGESHAVQVGRLCLSLRLDTQDMSGFTTLPIARIAEVSADGAVVLDPNFIPSAVQLAAAPMLVQWLTELHGMMRQRGESIAGRLSDARRGGSAEVADYLLLQVINRLEPLLDHYCSSKKVHPLALFESMLQLTGELSTFLAADHRPPACSRFDPRDLQGSFLPLVQTLRGFLSQVYEQTAIALPLAEKKYGIHVSEMQDRSLLESAQFVLAVRADVADSQIRSHFPAQIKIGPVERIRQLVNVAMPGIALSVLPAAPRQIPFRAGYTYFELTKEGQFFEEMQRSGGFALHVGGDFPGLSMEFWAIRQ